MVDSVVVCTDLSGKEPYREVGVGSMVTSGSLGGVMVNTLAWNARNVGTMFPIFTTLMKLVPRPGSCTSYALYGC